MSLNNKEHEPMSLPLFLKCIAPIFFLVGITHLLLGSSAEVLLGAVLFVGDPVLDSQDRFYGTAFMLYGAVLILCSKDMKRYAPLLTCFIWCLFTAGLARLVSIAVVGLPSAMVMFLLLTELAVPLIIVVWRSTLHKTLSGQPPK
jgi:Domain of unknown function (DUF4345)